MGELRALDSLHVVVADDHPYYRAGLARVLRGSGVDVIEVPNGEAAIRAAVDTDPDVVVMDLQMPGVSGLEATRALTARAPPSRVVVLSVSAEEEDVSNAILAGASGYVLKDEAVDEVIAGIRAAASGQCLVSPRVAQVLLRRIESSIHAGEDLAGGGLSHQELEVLRRIAAGDPPDDTDRVLPAILSKLQLERRVDVALHSLRRGKRRH
jgi:DNA-binding NarL/FixJ family response regulator